MSKRDIPVTALATSVRKARLASGKTLRTLADELGVDFTYLSKIENGHNRPSDALVAHLDIALGAEGSIAAARAVEPCPRCGRGGPVRAQRDVAGNRYEDGFVAGSRYDRAYRATERRERRG